MTNFYFNHDPSNLPAFTEDCHPVQIFHTHQHDINKHSLASRQLLQTVRDLGLNVDADVIDLVTIATAVTAADTFEQREKAENAWARKMHLHVPVTDDDMWNFNEPELSSLLNFLTGDQWQFTFEKTTMLMPKPKTSEQAKAKAKSLIGLNSVCLFSGGLDSAVGAIDILNGKSDLKPLLVSHAYRGDGAKQQEIKQLLSPPFGEISYSVSPHIIKRLEGKTDISMRGRSFNFLAVAVLGISALRNANCDSSIETIVVPENGYISINPPLTRRRIGSHSTRTTHPNFLERFESLLKDTGFNVKFINPYQFKTKGEMLAECADQKAIKNAVPLSVSCSHWHRDNKQCGHCVPCLIRRASVYHAGFTDDAEYKTKRLKGLIKEKDTRDDLQAVQTAIIRLKKTDNYRSWLRSSGSIPQDSNIRDKLESTIQRGLAEVKTFLDSEK
ncbi:Qat anti-phage system QueC-like protein QatC [uncultured Paraglaciecola sp.]|uniref:Qat anti-phage system QueC-like protein QatC n=1 Tax=uncultured Paraglaciecola sp. TaxID=1765024 RepID=UPI00260B55D7|nr:Qat anti-phage system QueC-like protein QatC [uncultured Paraglaciecola sp.]